MSIKLLFFKEYGICYRLFTKLRKGFEAVFYPEKNVSYIIYMYSGVPDIRNFSRKPGYGIVFR